MNKDISLDNFSISADKLRCLIDMETQNKIDHTKAKKLFLEMTKTDESPDKLFIKMGFNKEDDLDDMEQFIKSIFKKFPAEHERLINGEAKLINFFIGNIIKESKGKYLPANITKYLNKEFA